MVVKRRLCLSGVNLADRFIAVQKRLYAVRKFTAIFEVLRGASAETYPVPVICGHKHPIQIATNSIRNFAMLDRKTPIQIATP